MNLLIHQGALGDWVLTFGLLRALGPTHTVVATAWSKANLAEQMFEHVEAVHLEHPDFTRLHAPDSADQITPRQRQRFEQVTQLISFVSDGADAWADNMRQLIASDARCYYVKPRPPADWSQHVCDWHTQQLRQQGYSGPVDAPLAPADRPAGPIVVHPGSGGRDKCWPRDRFEALIGRLRAPGREVRVVMGEVEAETWPADMLADWSSRFDAECLPALELLHEALSGARLFVGNDAGPTHLAAQMGVATVALFGPSDPTVWSPRGPAVTLLAPPAPKPMTWLGVHAVYNAVASLLH